MQSHVVVRQTAFAVGFVFAFGSAAPAAELDQMFNSLGSAYNSMEGAKACNLESQIGPELLAFATQRIAKLEQTSKLSQAQKTELSNKAAKEAPMLVVIGACQSVLAAFQILDLQQKFLEAQQASKVQETNKPQSASPPSKPEPGRMDKEVASPQTDATSRDETQLPIAAGAYVRSERFCNDLRNGKLDLIDFDLEENRRTFSTGENSCIVSAMKKISASRTKIDADCTEFGDVSQLTLILDRLPNGNIRINGDDRLYCPTTKAPPQVPQGKPASTKAAPLTRKQLIQDWLDANEDCRGGHGNDPATWKACDRRADVRDKLFAIGYCEGDVRKSVPWVRCR